MATITYTDTGVNDANRPMVDWLSWVYEASTPQFANQYRDFVISTHEHSPLVNWVTHFTTTTGDGSYNIVSLPGYTEVIPHVWVAFPDNTITGYALLTPDNYSFVHVDGLAADVTNYNIYDALWSGGPYYRNFTGAYSAFIAAAQQLFGGGDDTIYGSSRGDLAHGYGGVDTFYGGDGDDQLYGDDGNDVINGEGGNDQLYGGLDQDTINGGIGNDTILSSGNDTIDGGDDTDTVVYGMNFANYTLTQISGGFTVSGPDGTDTLHNVEFVQFADQVVSLVGVTLLGDDNPNTINGSEAGDVISGLGGIDTLNGLGGVDVLEGGSGNDFLHGGTGDDVLKGGGGADQLFGEGGTDTASYIDSPGGVTVNLQTGAASGGDAQGDTFSGISNIFGSGYGDSLTGNDLDNSLLGAGGDDILNGLGGNNTLRGGPGDDSYYVASGSNHLYEDPGQGTDTVYSWSFIWALGPNFENLVLLPADGTHSDGIQGFGNTDDNHLTGNAADNVLRGDAGNDSINGGLGNDSLSGDAGFDYVDYSDAPGPVTIDLGPTTAQNTGSAGTDTLDGFEGIIGSAYDDILLRGFADTVILRGGGGNDTFHDHNAGNDTFDGQGGSDTVDYITGGTNTVSIDLAAGTATSTGGSVNTLISIENAGGSDGGDALYGDDNAGGNRLEGRGGGDLLSGRGGDDTLDGGTGADTMVGGLGNDVYYVDNAGDVVTENANEGTDEVRASLASYTLGANLENLTGTAAGAQTLTGNGLANVITGGGGAATMAGGAGNDTYVVDNAGDVVVENANEGTDTVNASISYTLGANLENLTLTGSADLQGYGNTLANALTGNAGNNLLDGGAGVDTMAGVAGNDVYFVDNAGDQALENANQGNDSVFSSVSFTLAANVENLILQGSADLQGYGNGGANVLNGNSGNNLLNGNGGVDLMVGGAGNDVYFADNSSDSCFEVANQGNDSVFASASYGLAANVENLILQGTGDFQAYGSSQANTIYGNSGNNLINAGGGIDLMVGGAGNDVYFVDDPSDSCFEVAGEGSDAVFASCNYGLAADVETLILQGSGDFQAYGSSQANTIYGNSGNNLINGGGGADTMVGGAGNDVYFVDNAGDGILESANEGNDAVFASVSYALSANVEGLVLQGAGNIDGIGNVLANSISGNAGINTLDGGGGADQLTGNAGNDIFLFRPGQANGDTVVDFAGNGTAAGDALQFVGYGLGATFTQIGATNQWQVNYNGGSSHDIITFSNGAPIDASDCLLV